MKKIIAGLLCVLGFFISSSVLAVSCDFIQGLWVGTLGSLTSVNLLIEDTGGASGEDAYIMFVSPCGASLQYGLMHGSCVQNADGTASMNFTRNFQSVVITLNTQLLNTTQLNVSTFNYQAPQQSGSGSGLLTKAQ